MEVTKNIITLWVKNTRVEEVLKESLQLMGSKFSLKDLTKDGGLMRIRLTATVKIKPETVKKLAEKMGNQYVCPSYITEIPHGGKILYFMNLEDYKGQDLNSIGIPSDCTAYTVHHKETDWISPECLSIGGVVNRMGIMWIPSKTAAHWQKISDQEELEWVDLTTKYPLAFRIMKYGIWEKVNA